MVYSKDLILYKDQHDPFDQVIRDEKHCKVQREDWHNLIVLMVVWVYEDRMMMNDID